MILCFNTQNAYSQDSLFVQKQDSLNLKKNKKRTVLDARIDYSAEDSLTFFLDNKDVFLYNKAKIDYDKMKLESGFMTVNFDTKTLFAEGVKDSTDTIVQAPIFKEGNAEYKSKELKYNFDTKQGIISNVFTKESDGYLHGEKVKKKDDRTMYISSRSSLHIPTSEDVLSRWQNHIHTCSIKTSNGNLGNIVLKLRVDVGILTNSKVELGEKVAEC